MSTLKGQTVVVTGGTRGIGLAIAQVCAREGARVVVTSRDLDAATRAAAGLGAGHLGLALDLDDADAIGVVVERLASECGSLDGWVNNAGMHTPGLLASQRVAEIDAQLRVNLRAPMLCLRALLPVFLRQRRGAVVNIASAASLRAAPGQACYVASKAGLAALTRSMAAEVARKGVRVNAVAPGPIQTEMLERTRQLAGDRLLARVPMRRLGQPQEVAEVVAFLLSERASYITGCVLPVDGGYSL